MNKMKLFLIHQERESHRRWGWNSMNWSIRVLRCRRVGGKFEIKGAQRPDLRKFIHRGRSKLTEEWRDTERERRESAVKRSMVSLRFTLRETLATVIRLCSIHIRGEGEKLARRSSSPAPLPASIPFLVRIRSHSTIPRRISNEMGTGFA